MPKPPCMAKLPWLLANGWPPKLRPPPKPPWLLMNMAPPPPPPLPAIDAVAEPVASTAPKAIVARIVVEFLITRTPSSSPAARRSDGGAVEPGDATLQHRRTDVGDPGVMSVAMGPPPTVLDPPGFEVGMWPANDNWR